MADVVIDFGSTRFRHSSCANGYGSATRWGTLILAAPSPDRIDPPALDLMNRSYRIILCRTLFNYQRRDIARIQVPGGAADHSADHSSLPLPDMAAVLSPRLHGTIWNRQASPWAMVVEKFLLHLFHGSKSSWPAHRAVSMSRGCLQRPCTNR